MNFEKEVVLVDYRVFKTKNGMATSIVVADPLEYTNLSLFLDSSCNTKLEKLKIYKMRMTFDGKYASCTLEE